MMARIALHGFVDGKVQGVGFRQGTWREAGRLGLAGWVRNRDDGRVETWIEGEGAAVDRLVDWLADGPPGAAVTEVRLEPCPPEGLRAFVIRR